MAKDPVCGMQVDESAAQWKSEHMGKAYYFCSPGCKKSFDENPMQYMNMEPGSHGGHAMHGHHG